MEVFQLLLVVMVFLVVHLDITLEVEVEVGNKEAQFHLVVKVVVVEVEDVILQYVHKMEQLIQEAVVEEKVILDL